MEQEETGEAPKAETTKAEEVVEESAESAEAAEGSEASPEEGGGRSRAVSVGIILAVMVVAGLAGRFVATLSAKDTGEAAGTPTPEAGAEPPVILPASGETEEFVYYEFDPVTVNLSEERLTRYLRATVTLKIREKDFEASEERIEEKRPVLVNWLVVNLSDCSLAEVSGARNLNRLRREILDAFNEEMGAREQPLFREVLFQEFAVQ